MRLQIELEIKNHPPKGMPQRRFETFFICVAWNLELLHSEQYETELLDMNFE